MSNFEGLKRAADFVAASTAGDVYPDIADLLPGSSSSEYASLTELGWQLLSRRRVLQFPDALLEQYDLMEARSFLGVFPEISRAWFTVDNRLYLWQYESGELYGYEQRDQIIVSVGLAKALPFLGAGIDYVLVIATPLEIVLLGVSLNAGANEGFRLFETPYSTTADGVSMTTIVGTPGGRIFMGGSNGNIYELCYQAEEGWFSRKCYKVNHSSSLGYLLPSVLRFGGEDPCLSLTLDNDRNLLYSLSAGGAIEAIHLGANGKEFRQFAHKSDICRAAAQLSQSAASKGCRIVSIHSLSSAESRRWQLVAVTSSGCRLYFSVYPRDTATASLSPGATSFSQQVPTTLDLVHVRLPPTDLASSEDEIHTAIYSDGLLLAARISNEEKDAVIGTGPDYHSRTRNETKNSLIEVSGTFQAGSRTIAIVPCQGPISGTVSDLINQTSQPPRQYLVLTSSGITFLTKERPLDVLLKLIAALPSSYGAISRFFDHFGRDEAALMCLLVATEFPDAQRQALELYSDRSGEPELRIMQPTLASSSADVGRPLEVPSYSHSGRLNGLVLLISRLVRSLWTKPILNVAVDKGQSIASAGAQLEDYVRVKLRLAALRSTIFRLAEIRDPARFAVGVRISDAVKGEQQLFQDITRLLSETIEAIEFIEILHELNIIDSYRILPDARKNELTSTMSLEKLVTDAETRQNGLGIVHDLFKRNPATRGTVDALSTSFQQRCPSFVTSKDIIWFRGIELLERSSDLAGRERDIVVAEAQNLWLREAASLSPDRVAEIGKKHKDLHFFAGTIEVAVACAQATDPYSLSIKYADGTDSSQQGKAAFDLRSRYYDIAVAALENGFTRESNERLQHQLVALCIRSADVLFLFRVYDWLLSKGRKDLLLEGEPETLERFLVQSPNVDKSNLLWQFLVKSNQHIKAARVLLGLAELKTAEIPLVKRVEYLSLAVSNARSAAPSSTEGAGALLNYVQDRLEVAQVQLEIRNAIEGDKAQHELEATRRLESLALLDAELYDVTELYKDFAAVFHLHDSILALLHVSRSAPQDLVTTTWIEILKEADRKGREQGAPANDPRFVSERVQAIGMRFYPDESVFPVYALCKSLEDYGYRHDVPDEAWVIRLMRNIGVPFVELFQKYDTMFFDTKTRGSPTTSHIAEAVCALIEIWLQMDSRDLRANVKTVNDTLVKMMLNGPSPRLTRVQETLREKFAATD